MRSAKILRHQRRNFDFAIDQRLQKSVVSCEIDFLAAISGGYLPDSTEPFDVFDEISHQPVKRKKLSVIGVIIRDRLQLRGTTNRRGMIVSMRPYIVLRLAS